MNIMDRYVNIAGETFANCKMIMRNLTDCDSEDSLREYWNRRNELGITIIESINRLNEKLK